MDENRTGTGPMGLTAGGRVTASACKHPKEGVPRKSAGLILCGSRRQSWNHVKASVGRFPP